MTLMKSPSNSSVTLKHQLIDCIKREKTDFMEIARTFYQQGHRRREDYIHLTKSVVSAIDHVLNEKDWEESLFLKNALKPLKEIRQQANDLLQEVTASSEKKSIQRRPLADDETLAYISLFQSEGHSLRKWELQLASLKSHLLGRPIYEKEEAIIKMIRQKLVHISEGYVVVAMKKTDIQTFAHQAERRDRQGNHLLTVTEAAIKPENIVEFVHQKKRYFFHHGKLILQV